MSLPGLFHGSAPVRATALLFAFALAWPVSAAAADYRAPRTAFGAPDLQGFWTNLSMTTLERRDSFKSLTLSEAEAAAVEGQRAATRRKNAVPVDPAAPALPVTDGDVGQANTEWGDDSRLARIRGKVRTSWIVFPADGRLPMTPAARSAMKEEQARETFDNPESRPLPERCLSALGSTSGPPLFNFGYNANYQIVQTPEHVAILSEMNHDVRIVRLAERAHLPSTIRPWMGDSVGWWEGDTLVVETSNINPAERVKGSAGSGHLFLSPDAKVIERFTRIAPDQILYAFTVEDPASYAAPWRAEMALNTARGPIYEYACHEGNYSLPNILAGARERERKAMAEPAKAAH